MSGEVGVKKSGESKHTFCFNAVLPFLSKIQNLKTLSNIIVYFNQAIR